MKVAGFTIVRNALKYDYPVVEAITSILPIVDEFVVAVGNSEDNTLDLIKGIGSSKIRIIETVWDDSLRKGGQVLAVETNKAFKAISADVDWAFYIQADEVVHEKFLPAIEESMRAYKDDKKVEGLLFDYLHFYGSYDYIGTARRWYAKEVRVIKNDPAIYSFRDAQGFQKKGRPLYVKPANASVYHYGWVKPPELQQAKQKDFHKMWHDDEWVKKNVADVTSFDYSQVDSLAKFEGSHPKVFLDRIARKNWEFTFDPTRAKKPSLKYRLLSWIEKNFGLKIGVYRNYRLL
jgi:hypothetical protein